MEQMKRTGRVTIPTNLDVVPETIEILKRWGADAIRDCDGTEFPEELTKVGAKIYSTYFERIASATRFISHAGVDVAPQMPTLWQFSNHSSRNSASSSIL